MIDFEQVNVYWDPNNYWKKTGKHLNEKEHWPEKGKDY